jgi:hypothetical protein
MPLLFGNTASSGSAIDGLSASTAAPSGVYLRNTLGITTDGTYWLNPTGSNAFQAYVINSRDGGGWVKFLQYGSGQDISTTSAVNQNGNWTQAEVSVNNPGKLSQTDINALTTGNSFLFRVAGSSDILLNSGAGTGKFTYASNLAPWGADVDPTQAYTLLLDKTNDGTYEESKGYTNDPQGRCTHTGGGASGAFYWYTDHNYTNNAICWSFKDRYMGSNLHWMAGNGGYAGGEIYFGNGGTACSLFIK